MLSTHENPDGDGLGSAYAMYHYLNNLKKDCRIVHISELPSEYMFFNNDNVIETYDPQNHDTWISKIDLALIFDVGDFRRLRDIGEVLTNNRKHVVNIDHHPDIASQYGIRSIPNLLIFLQGKVQQQIVGAVGKGELTEALDKLI